MEKKRETVKQERTKEREKIIGSDRRRLIHFRERQGLYEILIEKF